MIGLCKPCLFAFASCLFCLCARGGYTHYFTWQQKPDEAALKNCIAEMRLVIEEKKSILAGSSGFGSPVVEPLRINLNGTGENSHEPFAFPGREGFNFCKTEYKPYDEVVTACLLVARDHFSHETLKISSDGSWESGAWAEGAKLYSSVTKRSAHNPMLKGLADIDGRTGAWIGAATVLIFAALFFWWKKPSKQF